MTTSNTLKHGAALCLAIAAGSAWSETLKPGLWEVSTRMQSGSGQMEAAMAQMQQQMASMSPEQRRMMQDMMAKQGVGMGGAAPGAGMSVRLCMTKEMVERNEIPVQQGNCRTTSQSHVGKTLKMAFSCSNPSSNGEAEVTIVGPEAYQSKVSVNTSAGGRAERMNMDSSGKWLGADCGSVKPMMMPKR